jgi:hypothetical protein
MIRMTILIAAALVAAGAASAEPLEVATSWNASVEDPFGHQHHASCGSYVLHAPSGARMGLAQFVATADQTFVQGDQHFPSTWEKFCERTFGSTDGNGSLTGL